MATVGYNTRMNTRMNTRINTRTPSLQRMNAMKPSAFSNSAGSSNLPAGIIGFLSLVLGIVLFVYGGSDFLAGMLIAVAVVMFFTTTFGKAVGSTAFASVQRFI